MTQYHQLHTQHASPSHDIVICTLGHRDSQQPDRVVYRIDNVGTTSEIIYYVTITTTGTVEHGTMSRPSSIWVCYDTMSGRRLLDVIDRLLLNWKSPLSGKTFKADSKYHESFYTVPARQRRTR